ncbi:MAG: hypothetical protein JKY87_06195 [Mariprofundus sp.]|nr:hypothetical protein [Mariprofundus sp.]
MFIKIDPQTLRQESISSEAMVAILEADMKEKWVDDALTDMVSGAYEHRNASAIYTYKASVT